MDKEKKKIAVGRIYSSSEYHNIARGSIVTSLHTGKLWRVIDKTDDSVTVIPYSGGASFEFKEASSDVAFGLIEEPESLPEKIWLR